MSLYGALFAGVSGLEAQSNTLSVISNNIANVNTVGYKSASGLFESLVTSSAGAAFSPGGVIGTTVQNVSLQGQLQSTSSPTDIAVQGNGFFVVNQASNGSGQVLFTRAGDFTEDSTGNFKNSAGFFLQAWPLDRDGNLPGAPGNTTDTTSSADLSSLQTVNVNSLTGSASATTNVSIGANLNSSQAPSLGAGVTATIDSKDTANIGNSGLPATGIIIPSSLDAVDSLAEGDSFKITTAPGGVNSTFTYGGFSTGNSVGSAHAATVSNVTALANPAFTLISSGSGVSTIQVNATAAPTGLTNGGTVTLANTGADFDGLDLNGEFIASNVTGTTYTITVNGTPTTDAATFDVPAGTQPQTITVHDASVTTSNLAVGDTVALNISGTPGNLPTGAQSVTVTGVSSGSFTYSYTGGNTLTLATAAGGGSTAQVTTGGHPTSGHITQDPRLFSGNILNADLSTDTFLGNLPTTGFTASALTFSIKNGAGTSTFNYVTGTPNSSQGQFNTLTNLVTAINDASTGLTARIVNGKLYVGSINANDGVTFTNGSTVGISGPPLQSGLDWTGELGLTSYTGGTNRFSNLQGLADDINATTGLVATVGNPTGASTLAINAADPLDTIDFADTPIGTVINSHAQVGSPLAELGIVATLNSNAPTAGDTGALGPSYDPTNSAKNMAGGAITPQFSRPVQVFDSLGTPHNLNIGFIKTGGTTWAVEVYAQPAGDVTTTNGLVAFGTLTFNGDGTLESVGGSINTVGGTPVNINWTDNALASSVSFDWGTVGPVGTGKADGMSQFDSAYNVNFVNQNGVPVGDLTSVAIDANGFITASYSNGQTQKLFKIPLAEFTDPNDLNPLSDNVYEQSEASGVVNLSQAGTSSAGTIASSSLEQSNVELADQLTTMIIAQRSYEANTKVISTADTLLQDLNQIIQ